MRSISIFFLVILLAGGVAAAEEFRGNIINIGSSTLSGGSTRGGTDHFRLRVDKYTSDEEMERVTTIFENEGPAAAVRALRQISAGSIRIGSRLGYTVGIIRWTDTEDGGAIIRAVTDRPLQFFEVRNNTRSLDHQFGYLEIRIDERGRGEGELIAAAEVELGDEGDVTLTTLGTQPFRLTRVRHRPSEDD
jgi:hypothetical protein